MKCYLNSAYVLLGNKRFEFINNISPYICYKLHEKVLKQALLIIDKRIVNKQQNLKEWFREAIISDVFF